MLLVKFHQEHLQRWTDCNQEKGDIMHKTHNSLPEEQRVKLVELLNRLLADSIDLMLQVKQAHWNVKGPQFMALHALFGQIASGSRSLLTRLLGVLCSWEAVLMERPTSSPAEQHSTGTRLKSLTRTVILRPSRRSSLRLANMFAMRLGKRRTYLMLTARLSSPIFRVTSIRGTGLSKPISTPRRESSLS